MKSFFSNKLFPLLLSLILTTACLSGCGKTDSDLTPVTLSEVAHSIFYAPQYAAIELGYFAEEGIDLTLVNAGGADKVMTSLISGDAHIGFMGSEASIYTYANGNEDYAVNFAQLTQRAGNFLVSRKPIESFSWDMLKNSTVLGGRAGGMPQMVFEYILRKNGIDPKTDLSIDQSISFGLTAAAFMENDADFTVEFEPHATALEQSGDGYVVASLGVDSGYVPYTAYCAKKSYFAENEAIIQAFTNAIQKGLDYVNSHKKIKFDLIWKGFAPTKFALYNETECYFDGRYIEKSSDFVANTAIYFEGEYIAIWNVMEPTDDVVLTSKIVHEMFHAFQNTNGWDISVNELDALIYYKYDEENLSIKLRENRLLLDLYKSYDAEKVELFARYRKYR